jgi:hypothetical protein
MPEPEQSGEIITLSLTQSVENASEGIAGREATAEQIVAVAQHAALPYEWRCSSCHRRSTANCGREGMNDTYDSCRHMW